MLRWPSMRPIDVVIPVEAKDYPMVALTVFSARRHVAGVRDIHLVCPERDVGFLEDFLGHAEVRLHAEESFPYGEGILERLHHFKPRAGWYLQQVVKLCAPLDIPGMAEDVLALDGDVVFYQDTDFLPGGVPQYLTRKFRIIPYFEYIERNFGYPAQHPMSAVCHLMLFQRHVLRDMEAFLQERQGREAPLWDLLVAGLEDEHLGMSEYETYFNFLHRFADRYDFEVTESITYEDLPRKAFSTTREESYVAYHAYLK